MRQYLDIVRNVLSNGTFKGNRTGTRALTTFCEVFRHDMADGFPLLTTKKMPLRTIAVELEGFIKGVTDKRWFQERNCKIWNEWANPVAVSDAMKSTVWDCTQMGGPPSPHEPPAKTNEELRKQVQLETTDLGPIYGYQWRSFNKTYPGQSEDDGDFTSYTDQLKSVVDTLKSNPDDRRMVVSAWNPNQNHMCALPPCHYAFTCVHINGKLNLCWKQRSCDLMLGVPFNIASYALLLELLCCEANLQPGELVGILEDCHIYENHIDAAEQQIKREPFALPKISFSFGSIFDWSHKDVQVSEYQYHEALAMKVAV